MKQMRVWGGLMMLAGVLLQAGNRCAEGQELTGQARQMVTRLQQWYDPATGLWKSTGWWNAANAVTVIVDYSRAASTREFDSVLQASFSQHLHPGFLNEYYDDEGWWALAWIDAYDLTQDPKYLVKAGAIFEDMSGGWDDVCGGGIWWSKERGYKNAIANELFLSVAAHLANRAHSKEEQDRYKSWAEREWAWFQNSGMITEDSRINDGLDKQCKNNQKTVWSYNQGVILAGLTELSKLHEKRDALREAHAIADAAIKGLTDSQGVLHDVCEPNCGDDAPQFKGIFVRNLAALQRTSAERAYAEFIEANARSIVAHQGRDHSIGVDWSKAATAATAATQTSGLDAVVAALLLERTDSR